MNLIQLIRVSKPFTFLFGKQFKPSLDHIEIDIVFMCNLKCFNCDRSCNQAPSEEYMSKYQIQKFLDESINLKKKWERIRICGGEPMLHPDIDEILKLLMDFKNKYSSKTLIEIKTNGYDPNIVKKIQYLSPEVLVTNTNKTSRFQKKFEPFNLAPRDKKKNFFTNFSNCCWISSYCGIGLNKFGYYSCATAGGIDRVAGFDIGLKNLPLNRKLLHKQAKILCALCGHFTYRKFRPIHNRIPVIGEPKSKTWIEIYQMYEKNVPKLTSY